jgi:hypothetical protein
MTRDFSSGFIEISLNWAFFYQSDQLCSSLTTLKESVVRYILQSETDFNDVVCGEEEHVQNKVISDWIVSNQSEYQ